MVAQDLAIMHNVYNSQSDNSYKFCGIKMVAQQVQLHVMTKNPTKYEHSLSYGFRGVNKLICR